MIQAHNVYQHITAVQEANRRYEQGIIPKMIMNEDFGIYFGKVVDEVFGQATRENSLSVIENYDKFWMQMQSGSQGISGKRTVNAMTMFEELFEVEENDGYDDNIEDSDELLLKNIE